MESNWKSIRMHEATFKKKNFVLIQIILHISAMVFILWGAYDTVYIEKLPLTGKGLVATMLALLFPFTLIYAIRQETKYGPDDMTIEDTAISFGPERKRRTFGFQDIEKVTFSNQNRVIDFSVDSTKLRLDTRRYVWDADKVIVPLLEALKKHGIKTEGVED